MMTYTTVQGDMWDSIAHSQLGDVKYTHILMKANMKYRNTYIFSAGIKLEIPDVSTTSVSNSLPPWKQVLG